VARNEVEPLHFRGWLHWAKAEKLKLDFNATCFSHPKAAQGFTLSSPEKETRRFWIDHVKCCRRIAAFLGRELKSTALHNLWIPDGSKDLPFDRWTPRLLLRESLDEVFKTEYSPSALKDSLESKLFGIASESYVVGSHEFYLGYALAKRKILCLDLGHFHPTESVADKLSALLQFFDELLLHLSRPVRWDSDHVVILDDEMRRLAEEVVRGQALERVHLAMDFFDASMNRVGAWVIGARAVLKAFLGALLQPVGGSAWVKLPYGEFVVDATRDAVLFAGGTGITAFTAFLQALEPQRTRRVLLFYGARTPDLFVYGSLARTRAREVPALRCSLVCEATDGRLKVGTAWPAIAALHDPVFYLSGPPEMLSALTVQLRRRGVPSEVIRTDAWE